MSAMATQVQGWKCELSESSEKLKSTKQELTKLKKSYQHVVKSKKNAVAAFKSKKKKSVFYFKEKGVFTEETHNLVHLLVKAGCSSMYINEVIYGVIKAAGFQAVGKISRTSITCIIHEGYYAAQIQLGYEMKNVQSMTFSADGTSHRSVNYNSQHVHLLAEDYKLSESDEQKHATLFLGIHSFQDGTSKESIADWQQTMSDIVDIYNQSPYLENIQVAFSS